jgi:hypothetical protein
MAIRTAKRLVGVEPGWRSTVAPVAGVVVVQPKTELEVQKPSFLTPSGKSVTPVNLPWPVVPKHLQDPDKEYSVLGRDMSTVTADEAKGDRCPGCNSVNYQHVEGCKICSDCGYSPCH